MAAKYRKFDPRTWDDEKFITLDEGEKLVFCYCTLNKEVNRCGLFVFSAHLGAEKIGTLPATFAKRFKKVRETFNWGWDDKVKVLYFPSWWKYNPPENENVLRGCLNDIRDLPKTPLIERFYGNFIHLLERFPNVSEIFAKHRANVTPNVTTQEQDLNTQEQEHTSGGENGTLKIHKTKPEDDPGFIRFWDAYPRHVKKDDAARAFAKICPDEELLDRILKAVALQCRSEDWQKNDGKYIPYPASWLNGKRWEDELKPGRSLLEGVDKPTIKRASDNPLTFTKATDAQ
jgi:hypothetical protein